MNLAGDHDNFPPVPPPDSSERSSLDWARKAGIAKNVIREMEVRVMENKRRSRRRRIAATASALTFMLVASGWWQLRRPAANGFSSPSVVVTLPTRQQLPDGSNVDVNEGASIAVDYSAIPRRVVLQRGEAHFEVEKNEDRPFIVSAAGVEVRAVGTAFSVQLGHRGIEILVTEGTVAIDQPTPVSSADQPATSPALSSSAQTIVTVNAGNRVRIELSATPALPPQVIAVPAEELADRLSWRVPRLEFSGTPLSEALALFNRHSAVHLTLADPHLGQLKLSGIVRADNTATLLQLLHSEFGLTEERRTEIEIVLRRGSIPTKPN